MSKNITREEPHSPAPIYRTGDEITFKFEGNVRATVKGSEVVDGKLWLIAHVEHSFHVPAGRVLHCERKEGAR